MKFSYHMEEADEEVTIFVINDGAHREVTVFGDGRVHVPTSEGAREFNILDAFDEELRCDYDCDSCRA